MNQQKFSKGFSLSEMLTTLGISAILAATAVPSFDSMINASRVEATGGKLVSGLSLARSEAITRNGTVAVCKSNGDSCTVGGNWADGWIVFVDTDGNGVRNTATEQLIYSEQDDAAANLSVTDVNYGTSIVYRGDGSVTTIGSIRICSAESGGVNIAVNAVGRAMQSHLAPAGCSS